jgi:nitroimidazol reductase NimA-like FMN-containing flavoprotein (pyridoxamine 5'-phosphate oxidase superfamily)
MARSLTALPPDECWQLIASRPWGRVAVVVQDHPEVFPVDHVVDDGTILFRAAEGAKLRNSLGRRVAFQVDQVDDDEQAGWSVLIVGYAREEWDRDRQPEVAAGAWWTDDPTHWIRVVPIKVTGRRIAQTSAEPPR